MHSNPHHSLKLNYLLEKWNKIAREMTLKNEKNIKQCN